jgi:WD40 repeat protein
VDEKVRIWDVRRGKKVKDLKAAGGSLVAFSPDNRWLVTGGNDGYRFWTIGAWRSDRFIPTDDGHGGGDFAFTHDMTLLAVNPAPNLVRLLDANTGQQWATLPAQVPVCFNGDTSLLVTGSDNQHIQVWDLRRIRSQLAQMDLD